MARSRAGSGQRRVTSTYRLTPRQREAAPNRNLLFLAGGAVLGAGVLLVAFVATGFLGRLGLGSPVAKTPATSSQPALAAGTYTTRAFQPQLTFTVPSGWWLAADTPDYLAIQPVDSDAIGIHLFRDPSAASQAASCPQSPEPGVGKLSTDLATWIRGRPGLVTSNPRLAEVGGLHGIELDLGIVDTWTASCPFANGAPTVPLFVGKGAELRWVSAGSERLRLSLLDVPGGGTVVVDIDAFEGQLMDGLVARATPIVQSFKFGTP